MFYIIPYLKYQPKICFGFEHLRNELKERVEQSSQFPTAFFLLFVMSFCISNSNSCVFERCAWVDLNCIRSSLNLSICASEPCGCKQGSAMVWDKRGSNWDKTTELDRDEIVGLERNTFSENSGLFSFRCCFKLQKNFLLTLKMPKLS